MCQMLSSPLVVDFMDFSTWLFACFNTFPIFLTEHLKALTIMRQIVQIYQNNIIWKYHWESVFGAN